MFSQLWQCTWTWKSRTVAQHWGEEPPAPDLPAREVERLWQHTQDVEIMEKWNCGGIKASTGDTQAPHPPHGTQGRAGLSTTFSVAISSVLMEFEQNALTNAGKCSIGVQSPDTWWDDLVQCPPSPSITAPVGELISCTTVSEVYLLTAQLLSS